MGEFIRIQSTKTITVTCGLNYDDVSTPDAHIPDRLRVNALWPKGNIQIREGVGNYPAYIKDWKTVQALVKKGIFTISDVVDKPNEKEVEVADKLKQNLKEINIDVEEKQVSRRQSLDELVEDK